MYRVFALAQLALQAMSILYGRLLMTEFRELPEPRQGYKTIKDGAYLDIAAQLRRWQCLKSN